MRKYQASLGKKIYQTAGEGYVSVEKQGLFELGLTVPSLPYCDWLLKHKLRQRREFKDRVLIERAVPDGER